ncbi:MAG: hypothetical protein ISR61_01680 [Desulfobacteraceae bacterium]|uniref:histidine kinase n=1 Tax=Candidatus Desulfacyla euxinica TaxID=2841693 RepID=A0A8J6N350_9DELT|nr:hypothetical protein [Candidatus Desulfacyla euxinica]MBL6977628.1 hypothetical protein [Desulfobacteraceae bacterium]MBL7216215.1 hypothetical protein [Desulfobacteraceae bacterium]
MDSSRFRPGLIAALFFGSFLAILVSVLSGLFLPNLVWEHMVFHGIIEVLGSFSAFILSILLLLQLKMSTKVDYRLWVVSGFFGMGILDFFHAFTPPGNAFVWLHSTAVLVGGLLFSLVWLPDRITLSPMARVCPWTVILITCMLGILSVFLPSYVPVMVSQGSFSLAADTLNIMGGILFLVAGAYFALRYLQAGGFDKLLLTALCIFFGAAGILFDTSQLWDLPWWIWHFLRLIGYLTALGLVFIFFQRSQESLRVQRDSLLAVFNHLPEILYVVDPATYELIFVNNTLKKSLGKDPTGGLCYRDLEGFDSPCEFCTNEIILKQMGEIYTWEHHKQLIGRDYLMTDQIVTWPDGRDVKLALAVDITLRKQVEEKLLRVVEDLKRSNRELQQFAYVASHDLQEPLRMIASYVQLLERRYKGKLDQDADDFIGYAAEGAKRMQRLIHDLLAFNRVGTDEEDPAPLDLNEALDRGMVKLGGHIEETGATVTHDTLPVIMADKRQITQLFQHLIHNASRFRGQDLPEIHISVQGDTEMQTAKGEEVQSWTFGVRDNGMGIEPQHHERIFQIFQRLNPRDKFPGNGIGLAICRKIVERHGGRMWVASKKGEGAIIYFTLPGEELRVKN